MAISSREAGWVEVSPPAPPAAQAEEGAASSRARAQGEAREAAFMGSGPELSLKVPVYIGDFGAPGQAGRAQSGLDPAALFAYEPRSFRLKKAENQANRQTIRESAMSRRCELTGKGLLV